MKTISEKTKQSNGKYHVSACCTRLLNFVQFDVFDEDYVCRGCSKRAFVSGRFIDQPKRRQLIALAKELLPANQESSTDM